MYIYKYKQYIYKQTNILYTSLTCFLYNRLFKLIYKSVNHNYPTTLYSFSFHYWFFLYVSSTFILILLNASVFTKSTFLYTTEGAEAPTEHLLDAPFKDLGLCPASGSRSRSKYWISCCGLHAFCNGKNIWKRWAYELVQPRNANQVWHKRKTN